MITKLEQQFEEKLKENQMKIVKTQEEFKAAVEKI